MFKTLIINPNVDVRLRGVQVEQELLELWSSVEKEKAAARERTLSQARSSKSQQRHTRAGMKVNPTN